MTNNYAQSNAYTEVVATDGVVHLRIAGELDIAAADDVRSAAETALLSAKHALCLDMSEVSFIDACGLGALLAIRNSASDQGVAMSIEKRSPSVARILVLTDLTTVFPTSTHRPRRAAPAPCDD
jgi:anti-anti-sigma factor